MVLLLHIMQFDFEIDDKESQFFVDAHLPCLLFDLKFILEVVKTIHVIFCVLLVFG